MEQQYSGSCHCGAVRFEAKADLDTAIKCNCSLCRKKNATMVRIPSENFKLIEGADQLGLYQWNTKVAKHYFCKNCGIYTFHRPRTAPDLYGLNVACLDGVDAYALEPELANGACSLDRGVVR